LKGKNRILSLIAVAILTIILFKLSTIGLRPARVISINLSKEEFETAKNLENIVRHLSLNIGNRNYVDYEQLVMTSEYIIQQFRELGYKVESQEYQIRGKNFSNIVAQNSADQNETGDWIIGAHYDTCFNPGADDNGSGVAGLIELARLFKDREPMLNLKFVAFTNEEPPFFKTEEMGSRVFVKNAHERGESIKGAVILESIGYYSDDRFSQRHLPFTGLLFPNRGNFIGVAGNFPSRKIVSAIVQSINKSHKIPAYGLVAPQFSSRH